MPLDGVRLFACLQLALVPAYPAGACSSRSREPLPLAASVARGFFLVALLMHVFSFVLHQPVFQAGCP